MASKPVMTNSRLLKRTTFRDEKQAAKKNGQDTNSSCNNNNNSHEAVIKCEVSTLSGKRIDPMASIPDGIKMGLNGKPSALVDNEVFDGMPEIMPSSNEIKRSTSLLKFACENEMRTRTPLTLPAPEASPLYPTRPSSTGRMLPHIGYRGFRKSPSAPGLKTENLSMDGAKFAQQSTSSRRHHVTQCTIDANNLQNLTVGGRQAVTPPLKANSFPTRAVPLQSAVKHNKAQHTPSGGKMEPVPPGQTRLLSVHNLEIDQQPRPPPSDRVSMMKHRSKTFHGRNTSSAKRDVNVRSTHPPFPTRSGAELKVLSHDQR